MKIIFNTIITLLLGMISYMPEISSAREIPYEEIRDFKFVIVLFFISIFINFLLVDKIKKIWVRIPFNLFFVFILIIKILHCFELNRLLKLVSFS